VIEGWAILPGLFFGADLPDVDACWLVAAETTPDAAGSRMDRDFYRGASDEEALITKFVERSTRYNGRSSTPSNA
jgi:hypothetical protein